MKIAVRYQSRGGNTREVAKTIAAASGVTAETVDTPLAEPVDLLLVGGGVYQWGIDPSLNDFIERLDVKLVASAAAFTTAGGMDKTKAIISLLESRGIPVKKETLALRFGLRNHAWFGGKGRVLLTGKQVDRIADFVRDVTGAGAAQQAGET